MQKMRFRVVMYTWLFFTIVLGAGVPVLCEVIFGHDPIADYLSVFSDGGLFVASAVIAADALGCFVKTVALRSFRVTRVHERDWSWMFAGASLIILISVSLLAGKAVEFRMDNPIRTIPPFALQSIIWFVIACVVGWFTVAGSEAV